MTQPDLHISKRLKDLLPSLTKEEREQLKANIEADGRVTDPILYWNDGKKNVVVDGMHRFDIARRGDIPWKSEPILIGDTYEDVEVWMLNRQLGRRNLLSPQAIRKVRGELYNKLKRKDGGHGDQGAGRQNVGPKPAAETVAKAAGVNTRTVERDGARLDALKKCTPAVQKGIDSEAFKATDAEVKTLSGLNALNQDNIAKDMRNKVAKTVTEAMEKRKIKQPAGKKAALPAKCSADFKAAVEGGKIKIAKEQITTLSGLPPKKRRQAELAMLDGKSAAHAINPLRPKIKTLTPAEKELAEAKEQVKIWHDTLKRWLSQHPSIDELREKHPSKQGDHVVKLATQLFESLKNWQKVIK